MNGNAAPRLPRPLKPALRISGLILIPAMALAATAAATRTAPDPPGAAAERNGPGIEAVCHDNDLDGYAACVGGCQPGGQTCGDCNDIDPDVHPGAAEICNHQDDDCDGTPDEGLPAVDTSRTILNSLGQTSDAFGSSIALLDDHTDDGLPELAIGARFWDNSAGIQTGSIAVVSGADGSLLCRMVDPQGISSDNIGDTTASIGDVNGDGVGGRGAGGGGPGGVF
jgi:hypothetical protein